MADPVVTLTNGVPTSGTGPITTLGQIMDPTAGPLARGQGAGGTTTLRVTMDSTQIVPPGRTMAAASMPVVMATDPLSAIANGLTSSRINSAATANANFLKASAGNVARIDLFNMATYDVFFKFFNKASAPTLGTDTPVWTIPLKTGTGFSTQFSIGKSFAIGIAYAITKLQADTDATAIAVGEVTGSIDWI